MMTSIIYDYPAIAAKMQGDEWWGSKKEPKEEDRGASFLPASKSQHKRRPAAKVTGRRAPLYGVSPILLEMLEAEDIWRRIVRGKVW